MLRLLPIPLPFLKCSFFTALLSQPVFYPISGTSGDPSSPTSIKALPHPPIAPVRAPDTAALQHYQKALQQEVMNSLQTEVLALQKQVRDQVGSTWKSKVAELEYVLRERFTSLQV